METLFLNYIKHIFDITVRLLGTSNEPAGDCEALNQEVKSGIVEPLSKRQPDCLPVSSEKQPPTNTGEKHELLVHFVYNGEQTEMAPGRLPDWIAGHLSFFQEISCPVTDRIA